MTTNEAPAPAPYAERAQYSAAREGKPIMPAIVRRPAPRSRRHSVPHRAYR